MMFSGFKYRLNFLIGDLKWVTKNYLKNELKLYKLWRQLSKTPMANTGKIERNDLELMSMVSHADLPLLIVSLKTFLFTSKQAFNITIIDDGSLLPSDVDQLRKHLKDVKIIMRAEADRVIAKKYQKRKRYLKFREKEAMVRKAIDLPLLASKPNILTIDSDILFFHSPDQILQSVADGHIKGAFISDITSAYTLSPIEAKVFFKLSLVPKLNGGLIYFSKSLIDLDLVEKFLSYIENETVLRRLFMQTYFALIFSRLDKDSLVRLSPQDYVLDYETVTKKDIVARHYVGTPEYVREFFFRDVERALIPYT